MDLNEVERRVRRAYEWGRLKRATSLSIFVSLVSALFAVGAAYLWLGVSLAASLTAMSILFLWRGQELERALTTGFLAGSVPLALALAARPFGHGCHIGGACYSWCMPACAIGAVIATGIVARSAYGSKEVGKFGAASGLVTVATGTLGCSCLSLGGAAALAAVFIVSAVPTLTYVARQQHRIG